MTDPSVKTRTIWADASGLLGWLLLCFAVSAIGAAASSGAGPFYRELALPAWAPPGWVFGPVWLVLYAGMAVSAWLVWRSSARSRTKSIALLLFIAQLFPNAMWSWLFFAWRRGGLSFINILALWVLIVCTMEAFRRVRTLAGLLLLPYLLWVSFATILNWAIWRANPELL